MNVIELDGYGAPEVLHVVERPEPAPEPGRARVRVEARGVNPVDVGTREGAFAAWTPGLVFPAVLGWDLAGVLLDDVPAGGGRGALAAGTRVAGFVPWFDEAVGRGTYAEVVLVDPLWVAPVPDALDAARAAVLGMNGLTGAQAVDMLGDVTGRTVLVTGASGPVGAVAAHTAVGRGATVLAVGSVGDDAPLAALGATHVLGRSSAGDIADQARRLVPDGVDGVFNAGLAGHELIAAVRDGGTFVSATAGYLPEPARDIAVAGVHVRPDPGRLAGILADVATGGLDVRVAGTLPLAQAAQAHRRVAAGGFRGKLVLLG